MEYEINCRCCETPIDVSHEIEQVVSNAEADEDGDIDEHGVFTVTCDVCETKYTVDIFVSGELPEDEDKDFEPDKVSVKSCIYRKGNRPEGYVYMPQPKPNPNQLKIVWI